MNIKSLKITVAKLKKTMDYKTYTIKYKEKISDLGNHICSSKESYFKHKDEFEDLKLCMYEKVDITSNQDIINFMVEDLGIKLSETIDDMKYKGSHFKVEFTKGGKLVLYSFGKRRSYEINNAYDVYKACTLSEVYI